MARGMEQTAGASRPAKRRRWLIIGGLSLGFWIVFLVFAAIFGESHLSATVFILGSFAVPVTIVVYNLDHLADQKTLSGERVTYAFLGGGLLALVLALPLNRVLVPPIESAFGIWGNLLVGFTEEIAKLAALVVCSIGLARFAARNGIVLGSAVGFGFAAFETAGYLSDALPELGLWNGVVVNAIGRGILTPAAHGLFTAVVGAALFRGASRGGRLRIGWEVVVAYIWVALLHGLYDVAASSQHVLLKNGGVVVMSLVGVVTLVVVWRMWVPKERTAQSSSARADQT